MFGTKVTEEHIDLFDRATDLLSRMASPPSVVSITAAFLDSRDQVRRLETEVAQLRKMN